MKNTLKKTLIIRDLSMYIKNDILDTYPNIKFVVPLKRIHLFGRISRSILMSFEIFLPSLIGDWIKSIDEYEQIILFADYSHTDRLAKYISKKTRLSKTRLIYWYWNPVSISTNPSYIKNLGGYELWSFDMNDSNQFNLKFNTTFYSNQIVLSIEDIAYDIYFVGVNKGRLTKIDELKKLFISLNLNFLAYVVDENNPENTLPFITVEQNLQNISKTISILDIMQEGQSGLTLRVMESLFFEKKLITTDKQIIKEPFYTPNNIFILEHDKINNLPDFLSTPYQKIHQDIVDYYDFDSWVRRFFEN